MDATQITSIVIAALITGCIAVGTIAQAWVLRRRGADREAPFPRAAALEDRLERIEQAIEAIAVEVERVGEAHRFTAKLLADRAGATSTPRPPGRVITPH